MISSEAQLEAAIATAVRGVTDGATTTTIVRSALRVAVLRQDFIAQYWLGIELDGISKPTAGSGTEAARLRLQALVGAESADRQRSEALEALMDRRTSYDGSKAGVNSSPVAAIDAQVETMQRVYDEQVTPGMTPLDTGLAAIQRDKARATLLTPLAQYRTILARVTDAAYAYVLQVEADLLVGQLIPDAMAQGRSFVEREMPQRAPRAWEALQAAETRLAEGSEEALSQAAVSCRRTMKLLADALYPAGPPVKDEGGVERIVDDERWKNRLTQYVRDHMGTSKHAQLIGTNIDGLSARLNALDRLSSKGVHESLSAAEVESSVTWTFLLTADLLRIAVGESGE